MKTLTHSPIALGGVIATVLCGCVATTMRIDPPLVAARDEVAKAQASPDVGRFAQADVDRARDYLAAAELADRNNDMALAAHEAYLATQTARLALATADEHVSQEQLASAGSERQQIQLDARAREAAAARDRAANAEDRAADAENRAAQAETTQQTATAAARDRAADAEERAADAEGRAAQAEATTKNAAAQASDLRAELTELHATQTARGPMIRFTDMLFDTAGDTLKPGADQAIGQLAKFLLEHPERRVLAEGYADSVGTPGFNQRLSERRARSLKDALVARGVDASRIDAVGFGSEYPIASNADAGGRQINRRVEVVISDASGQIAAR